MPGKENSVGLCLGCISQPSNLRAMSWGSDADSGEFTRKSEFGDRPDARSAVSQKGGTMRLGATIVSLKRAPNASPRCQKNYRRHRHRYEFNNEFRDAFRKKVWFSVVTRRVWWKCWSAQASVVCRLPIPSRNPAVPLPPAVPGLCEGGVAGTPVVALTISLFPTRIK